MALGQSSVRIAFDATAVSGARPTRGLRARRLASFARAPLADGALVPSPHESNVLRAEEVRDALALVARSLDAAREPVAFLLPDGVARLALLDAPDGVRPDEYARYRLAPGLPYPIREAVVQTESAGPRRVLAALARRSVIAEYEEVARAAGLVQGGIDLVPLAALHALRRAAARGVARVDVVLGDAAYSLALHDGAGLRVLRNRRRDRDAGEPSRLALEIERVLRIAGMDARPAARVVGPGATALLAELAAAGGAAEPGWSMDGKGLPADAVEVPWLGSLFA
jgi:Tfp pilus assembly PilM family ATPase